MELLAAPLLNHDFGANSKNHNKDTGASAHRRSCCDRYEVVKKRSIHIFWKRPKRQGRPDGVAAVRAAMQGLEGAGESGALLVDIDFTLTDPRPRLLKTVHAFGYKHAKLSDMMYRWEDTASALGIDPKEFKPFWEEHYWKNAAFDADTGIEEVIELLREAEEKGINIVLISGRYECLYEVTCRQLHRLKIPFDKLILKPEGCSTVPYKVQKVRELAKKGLKKAVFLSDRTDELLAVRALGAKGCDALSVVQVMPREFLPAGHQKALKDIPLIGV